MIPIVDFIWYLFIFALGYLAAELNRINKGE